MLFHPKPLPKATQQLTMDPPVDPQHKTYQGRAQGSHPRGGHKCVHGERRGERWHLAKQSTEVGGRGAWQSAAARRRGRGRRLVAGGARRRDDASGVDAKRAPRTEAVEGPRGFSQDLANGTLHQPAQRVLLGGYQGPPTSQRSRLGPLRLRTSHATGLCMGGLDRVQVFNWELFDYLQACTCRWVKLKPSQRRCATHCSAFVAEIRLPGAWCPGTVLYRDAGACTDGAPLLNRPKQAQSLDCPLMMFLLAVTVHLKPAAYTSQTLTFLDTSHTHLQRKAHPG